MNAFEKLTELGKLNRNWDSYGAEPIDLRCVERARLLLTKLGTGWTPVPTINGGIQLEYHADGFDCELLIERSDD